MTFYEACLWAIKQSRDNLGCSFHVNGRIVLDKYDAPIVKSDSWTASPWYVEGSTVRTFVNGKMINDT